MNNDIVQLTDKSGNNIYPIAGAATQDSISKSMLAEGVFEGPELFPSPNEAYVRTANIVDGAITSDKIDSATIVNSNIAGNTITLDKLKMPRITIAGVDGNQQSSVYKITLDPSVEPYTVFVGTVYVRHIMPSTFRITVGATTGVVSSAVFTDSTNFSATTSGNTVTVTYSGGQWSMFYLAYMEYKATMGMTITRE